MNKIIFASNNAHKLKEVRQILDGFEVLSMKDIGFSSDIEEYGLTLADNAKIKAYAIKEYCLNNKIDYPIFSDDSGLFANALGGQPGIYSARYAESHNDEANRQKLIKNLADKADKTAYFECVICLLDETEHLFSGKTHGTILSEYKGKTDFGYDCIFLSEDLQKSFGEATDEEKDSVSHRGRAVLKMKEYLTK